jgi:hypothetical protein
MLHINDLKRYYPAQLHGFGSFMLREYLQCKILEIIFSGAWASKLCFLGGTCLRLMHNNTRFSEDLDFDNFGLAEEDFNGIAAGISKGLGRQGFVTEVENVFRGAYHCYIKFPGLLYSEGLSGHREEKILVQLDTEPQKFDFQPQRMVLNRFDVFETIFTTPLDILLSQKLYAIYNRKRRMGRDFFDATFLLPLSKPNYGFLNQKMGVSAPEELRAKLLAVCEEVRFDELAKDIEPYLFQPKDVKRVLHFQEYIRQAEL